MGRDHGDRGHEVKKPDRFKSRLNGSPQKTCQVLERKSTVGLYFLQLAFLIGFSYGTTPSPSFSSH